MQNQKNIKYAFRIGCILHRNLTRFSFVDLFKYTSISPVSLIFSIFYNKISTSKHIVYRIVYKCCASTISGNLLLLFTLARFFFYEFLQLQYRCCFIHRAAAGAQIVKTVFKRNAEIYQSFVMVVFACHKSLNCIMSIKFI